MTRFPPPSEQDIQYVVDLVVDAVDPLRVVLFGSAARGEQRPGSDVDLMVVVSNDSDLRSVERTLYALRRPVAVDFIVTTPQILDRHGDDVGYVYRRALRDGKDLYAA